MKKSFIYVTKEAISFPADLLHLSIVISVNYKLNIALISCIIYTCGHQSLNNRMKSTRKA